MKKQLYFLIGLITISIHACKPTAKVLEVLPGNGEKVSRNWDEYRMKSLDTAKQYRIAIADIRKRKIDSLCQTIETNLYSTNNFFGRNFYARDGVLFIERRYCDFDDCFQKNKVDGCHAKFIIYSDTTQILTDKSRPCLATEILMIDKNHAGTKYKFFFQVYISIWSKLDNDRVSPLTDVNINLVINAQKIGKKSMRWVNIRDEDIDESRYEDLKVKLQKWMLECADKIINQNYKA